MTIESLIIINLVSIIALVVLVKSSRKPLRFQILDFFEPLNIMVEAMHTSKNKVE